MVGVSLCSCTQCRHTALSLILTSFLASAITVAMVALGSSYCVCVCVCGPGGRWTLLPIVDPDPHLLRLIQLTTTVGLVEQPHGQVSEVVELLPRVSGQGKVVPGDRKNQLVTEIGSN